MKLRFKTRTLLLIMTLSGVVLALFGREMSQAYREQSAFRELQRLGAFGDDWPGWKELFLGREYAPIVEISLPKSTTLREALAHLTRLDNLESLAVNCESVSLEELDDLQSLDWIDSLNLNSAAVSDDAVLHLMEFRHLRWLYLDGTQISGEGRKRLQAALPQCSIEL